MNIKTNKMKTLQEQAEAIKAKGSPLTIEQIISFLEKNQANKAKREKRSAKAWQRRDEFNSVKTSKSCYGNMTIAEINRMNAMNNLPSSMR